MSKCVTIIGVLLLFSISVAPAQTPSPDATSAARKLVDTLKLSDQFKAQLPVILLNIKPVVVQGRPEIERDYDMMTPTIADAYTPYFNAMVDAAATVYANNFTADELREIDALYRRPAGQKLLQKSPAITRQIEQIGQDGARKAGDDLRTRLTDLLRQKGHKM
jgi:uncharacterized protein